MRRFYLLALCLTLSLMACAASPEHSSSNSQYVQANTTQSATSQYAKDALVQELIAKKDFIGLFDNSEKIGVRPTPGEPLYVTGAVKAYLNQHGNKSHDVLQLLKESGFRAGEYLARRDYRPADNPNLIYDRVIGGSKTAMGPLIFTTEYRAAFYYRGDVLVWQWAWTATNP